MEVGAIIQGTMRIDQEVVDLTETDEDDELEMVSWTKPGDQPNMENGNSLGTPPMPYQVEENLPHIGNEETTKRPEEDPDAT